MNWENKIRAFLHDPPDKVIVLSDPRKVIEFGDHRKRRNEILGELKFREDRGIGKEIKYSDETASSLQRIDLEIINGKRLSSTFYRIHGEDLIFVGEPVFKHPITGEIREYEYLKSILPKDEISEEYPTEFEKILKIILEAEKETFNELISITNDDKDRYFVIWRFYPELLKVKLVEKLKELYEFDEICERIAEDVLNLTAYTLSPDHTLFDHADATSAIFGAINKNKQALLMFKLTPVQNFIKNARKERDLWAGSHMLSYLTFQAIKAIVEECGPDTVIFPHLRGQPFFDKEFEDKFKDVPEAVKVKNLNEKLKIANIPNKFLAIIGVGEDLNDLRDKVKNAVLNEIIELFDYAWERTIDEILKNVESQLIELKEKSKENEKYEKVLEELKNLETLKNYYRNLIENYFDITLEIFRVPFTKKELEVEAKDWRERIRKSYEKLESYIKNLGLPENVEKKYLDWLDLLRSFGAYPARIFDLYSLMFELLEEIIAIESRKFEKLEGSNAYKCSLCGEIEAIGGKNYALMKALWLEIASKNPLMFKSNEHLCPVCLAKRFYHEWFKEKKDWDIEAGFESVSEVALRKNEWLKLAKESEFYNKLVNTLKRHNKLKYLIRDNNLVNPELLYIENWNAKYIKENFGIDVSEIDLEEPKRIVKELHDEHGEPEKYYAILMMDGDNMGRMLIGDEMGTVDCYLHPNVVDQLPDKLREKIRKVNRLITPATHSAISRALAHFSINIVPDIVKNHRGELIYAGGDDVLALLPIDSALICANEIQKKFNDNWDGWNVLPAKTMSAGILIVHYKHPLYDALDRVRELERKAKGMGRNAVAVGYLTRGGSYYEVVFNWNIIPELEEIVELILSEERPRISGRFIYDVIENIENLPRDENAIKAYLKFELLRHYEGENKKKKAEDLSEKILKLAKGVRISLSSNDLEGLIDLSKVKLNRLNEEINKLISKNELSVDGLSELFKLDCNKGGELYGLILRKQVRGLFILLKILRDCYG